MTNNNLKRAAEDIDEATYAFFDQLDYIASNYEIEASDMVKLVSVHGVAADEYREYIIDNWDPEDSEALR